MMPQTWKSQSYKYAQNNNNIILPSNLISKAEENNVKQASQMR